MQGKKDDNIQKMLASLESLAETRELSATTRRHIGEVIELVKKDLAKVKSSEALNQ